MVRPHGRAPEVSPCSFLLPSVFWGRETLGLRRNFSLPPFVISSLDHSASVKPECFVWFQSHSRRENAGWNRTCGCGDN